MNISAKRPKQAFGRIFGRDNGIEAFFAPKHKALQLERELRDGGVAVLMVADSGRVTLKDIVPGAAEE